MLYMYTIQISLLYHAARILLDKFLESTRLSPVVAMNTLTERLCQYPGTIETSSACTLCDCYHHTGERAIYHNATGRMFPCVHCA